MSDYTTQLVDAMRAEHAGVDLDDMGHEIRVNAMREDGTLYTLGYVSAALCYQNPVGASLAVSHIKFARRSQTVLAPRVDPVD